MKPGGTVWEMDAIIVLPSSTTDVVILPVSDSALEYIDLPVSERPLSNFGRLRRMLINSAM